MSSSRAAVAADHRGCVDGGLVDERQLAVAGADVAAAFDQVAGIDERRAGAEAAENEVARGRAHHGDDAAARQRDLAVDHQCRIDPRRIDQDQAGIGETAHRKRARSHVESGAGLDR